MPKQRCPWAGTEKQYVDYHDKEWGVPVFDDRLLFEFLVLEGAQAGLNWALILKKREGYRKAFANFEIEKVARFSDKKIEKLLLDPGIIRNRLKVESTVNNAKRIIEVRKEFGGFSDYIWSFVDGKPVQNAWKSMGELPDKTEESVKMSKDLKKRGFRFVGPTVCYSFMQAVGLVNDHIMSCFRYNEIRKIAVRM
jgi:DNA-3-methyladenine glycosylase I